MTLQKHTETPPLIPWYALILTGYALGGFVSWIMVIRQTFRRNKPFALALLTANILILAVFGFASVRAKWPWDQILYLFTAANLAWAAGAWLFQRLYLGPAPRRCRPDQWRRLLSPVAAAVIIAIGLAIIVAVFPVMGERLRMMSGNDILDKRIILWDFFTYVPYSIPYGLLVGLWWAGEDRRFSAPHILTYLSGLVVFYVILTLFYQLFFFLAYKGQPYAGYETWPLLPDDLTGPQNFLLKLAKYDQLTFVIAPLLLGSVGRIRDFWSRALVIFPALCFCFLPLISFSNETWRLAQGHIMHELTSPDNEVRDSAFKKAEVLIARYPGHDRWPEFALAIAGRMYENSDYESAQQLYREIKTRTMDSPRWRLKGELAASAIGSAGYGAKGGEVEISLPLVNHESYLTPNWMALLQVIRFWSDADTPESEILIQLKSLSKSDEKIELSSIPSLAELDDAAASLGYETLILPTNLDNIKSLLRSDFPVFVAVYDKFYLLRGIDESRSFIRSYSYWKISERLRKDENKDAGEILFPEQEGKGESLKQLEHIAAQASTDLQDSFWGSDLQIDSAPYMAVVYPHSAAEKLAGALPGGMEELRKQSNGRLAALIALNALDAADPVQAVRWAMASRQLVEDPLALHVASLAERLWRTRDAAPLSRLDLELRFPRLAEIEAFFNETDVTAFLAEAKQRFETDREDNKLTWKVRNEYADFLDRSNPAELALLTGLALRNTEVNPGHRAAWLELAEAYEWRNDALLIIPALEGALAADSWNDELALLLAYRYVQANQRDKARSIMDRIDPAAVGRDAHYTFCRGVLADWDGNRNKALAYYARAIEMRRSVPLYHLYYGQALLQDGKKDEARQTLQWAARIDVENGEAGRAAQALLETI